MSCSPVIHPESGPARKTATAAMSAGCPVRPSEACAAVFFSQSEPMKPPARVPSVSTMPGLMELTRIRSEEHTSELQSRSDLVCRLLLEKKKKENKTDDTHDDKKT